MLQDLRYALRMLGRTPGFTAVAILVLALGIGANAAVFTIVNALMLKPLPGADLGPLVGVYARSQQRGEWRGFSYPNFVDLRAKSDVFTGLLAQEYAMVGVTEGASTRRVFAGVVSSDFFPTMGTPLARGRAFRAEEEAPRSGAMVAIVSYEYWRARGFDPALVGQALRINGQPFTIVGIAAEGFTGTIPLFGPELWLPFGAHPVVRTLGEAGAGVTLLDDRSSHRLVVAGRLKPGLSAGVANERLHALATQLAEAHPAENRHHTIVTRPLGRTGVSTHPQEDSEVTATMAFLLAMSGIVLLVACLNLANMLLARGTARRREMAIRIAMGAGRVRIVRQLLVEGFVLAIAGGVAGLLVASWSTRLLAHSLTAVLPLSLAFDPTPDVRVLAATLAFATVATLAAALGPAWTLSRSDVVPDLKEAPAARRGARGWRAVLAPRQLLVVGQVALSLALLTAGGMFVHGAWNAAASDPGFGLERGLVVGIDPSLAGYDEAHGRMVLARAAERVRGMPGVESASFASLVPFGNETDMPEMERFGRAAADGDGRAHVHRYVVGADYFRTLGIPVIRGRAFTEAEEQHDDPRRIVVVDETLARAFWPGQDPIGQSLRTGGREPGSGEVFEVIGVVGNTRHDLLEAKPSPHAYLPMGAHYRSAMHLHVRVRQPGEDAAQAMLATVVRELRDLDGSLPIVSQRTLEQHRGSSLVLWMIGAGARLFTTFGVLALVLAAVGLYGVKSYLVSRRTREIGIRMALGAQPRDVLWMVVRQGLGLTAVGLGVGLVLSAALGTVLAGWLYEVPPIDPLTFTIAPLVLGTAAFIAAWLPARRAMRVQPVTALRTE